MNPQTIPEWLTYIDTLSGAALRSKALAANSLAFIRGMGAEGLTPDDIHAILVGFAKRLEADDQVLPGKADGLYVDYSLLLHPVSK